MKKLTIWLIISVFAVIMTFIGTGCKEPEVIVETVTETVVETVVETVEAEAAEGEETSLTIAMIYPLPWQYYEMSAEGVRFAGEIMDAEIVEYLSELKPEKELAAVEDAVLMGVDGIILISVSTDAAKSSIDEAYEAGIPIHLIYGYTEEFEDKAAGFVQANTEESGGLAGEWIANNVDSGEVAIIEGILGRGDAEGYSAGFENAIAENPDLELVTKIPGDWDPSIAYNVMSDIITGYPDLKVVFVQNEGMAGGAIKALEEAGKLEQVTVVSQNGSPEGLLYIQQGKLKATVGWSPSQESQIAFKRLMRVIQGETLDPKLVFTPMKILTADNLAEVITWEPTVKSTKETLEKY